MTRPVLFYSTNLKSESVPFRTALIKGLAPDKGLYMPDHIPVLEPAVINGFSKMDYHEIAYTISREYLRGQIEDRELLALAKDAYNYEVPLEKVDGNRYVMRLDQGPTASFKDFAARMMGRLINYYLEKDHKKMLILTATSGDTGSAIANAFYGLDNVKVLVLFPENEVTSRQRKQMTTLGKNITILSLDGKFDDCQALVKEAFIDPELDYLDLSSANSINIGRLIPQTVYYFYAFSRLRKGSPGDDIVFSVPSGNFGDMMGGMLAMKMGLPVRRMIIATNENDEFPELLRTGKYSRIEPSKNCISSAMNVGHPSNLARLIALYNGVMDEKGNITVEPDMALMRKELYGISVTDQLTKQTIKNAWDQYNLLLEPHGAVGWCGLETYCRENPDNLPAGQLYVSLETAHPAKFPEQINEILRIDPELPPSLKGLDDKPEFTGSIPNNYMAFKTYLKQNF